MDSLRPRRPDIGSLDIRRTPDQMLEWASDAPSPRPPAAPRARRLQSAAVYPPHRKRRSAEAPGAPARNKTLSSEDRVLLRAGAPGASADRRFRCGGYTAAD